MTYSAMGDAMPFSASDDSLSDIVRCLFCSRQLQQSLCKTVSFVFECKGITLPCKRLHGRDSLFIYHPMVLFASASLSENCHHLFDTPILYKISCAVLGAEQKITVSFGTPVNEIFVYLTWCSTSLVTSLLPPLPTPLLS